MRRTTIVCLIALLSACGWGNRGGYYEDDGPPRDVRIDLAKVPDAVPRYEPPSATGNEPYTALGRRYVPMKNAQGYTERGVASWYGRKFHGKRTSSGDPYDMFGMTAAHRTLPLPSYARVRNLRNGRSVVVRVNDRGPFLHNRLIDLSYAAAHKLGIAQTGTGLVEVTAVFPETEQVDAPVAARAVGEPVMYVQVGAFTVRENAEGLRIRLKSLGFEPMVMRHARDGVTEFYRVRMGPVASVEDADVLIARVQQYGYEPQLVIECPGSNPVC